MLREDKEGRRASIKKNWQLAMNDMCNTAGNLLARVVNGAGLPSSLAHLLLAHVDLQVAVALVNAHNLALVHLVTGLDKQAATLLRRLKSIGSDLHGRWGGEGS